MCRPHIYQNTYSHQKCDLEPCGHDFLTSVGIGIGFLRKCRFSVVIGFGFGFFRSFCFKKKTFYVALMDL
jgi:hypothetical protein